MADEKGSAEITQELCEEAVTLLEQEGGNLAAVSALLNVESDKLSQELLKSKWRDKYFLAVTATGGMPAGKLLKFNSYLNKADLLTRLLRSKLHVKIEEYIGRIDLDNKEDRNFALKLLEIEAKLVPKESKFDGKVETTNPDEKYKGKSVAELQDKYNELRDQIEGVVLEQRKNLLQGAELKISDAEFEPAGADNE